MKSPVRLLFVEDNDVDREAFFRIVEEKHLPYDVTTAQTLKEARLQLQVAQYDTVVADYHLPDGHSTELFEDAPETPFIVLTGTLQEELALRTLGRGADDYLVKDPEQHHLEVMPMTVEKALYRRHFRDLERRLTRQLRASEERFRLLVEGVKDHAIFMIDCGGRITTWNPGAEQLYGWTGPEIVGQSLARLLPPEEVAGGKLTEELARATESGHFTQEAWRVRKDGTRFWASVTVSSLRPNNGDLRGYATVTHDLTERRRVENALRDDNRRRGVLNEVAAHLLSAKGPVDLIDGVFVRMEEYFQVNAFAAFRLSENGRSLELHSCASLSQETRQRLGRVDLQQADAFCAVVARERKPRSLGNVQSSEDPHLQWVRAEGLRAYYVTPLLVDERLVGILAFGSRQRESFDEADQEFFESLARYLAMGLEHQRLIVELRGNAVQLESAVAERTASLQEMVAELEHFSYAMTHDMRSPLRAMRGLAGILLEEGAAELKPEHREYLHRIALSAERMDALVKDALQYSLVLRGKLEVGPIDADALVRELLDSNPELQPPRANVRIVSPLPVVRANRAGLIQCFSNLLGNAVKFVLPGCTPEVLIGAEDVPTGERRQSRQPGPGMPQNGGSDPVASDRGSEEPATSASPERERPGRAVRMFVQDNGIGIDRQHRDKIWVMFQRLDRSYPGTGIGLALVRKAVERMGGRVGVESEPGRGSRFWIELERAEPQPAPERPREEAQA